MNDYLINAIKIFLIFGFISIVHIFLRQKVIMKFLSKDHDQTSRLRYSMFEISIFFFLLTIAAILYHLIKFFNVFALVLQIWHLFIIVMLNLRELVNCKKISVENLKSDEKPNDS